jgi:hypothetical protein
LSEPEFNPYAATEAPAPREEAAPRSSLSFYFICLAASLLLVAFSVARVFGPLDWMEWPLLVLGWIGGVLWILWPELRQPGGMRNIGTLRLLVVTIGFVVMTYAMTVLLMLAWWLIGLPVQV